MFTEKVHQKVLNEKISLNPIQFYATTKVCNEEMAKIYSKYMELIQLD